MSAYLAGLTASLAEGVGRVSDELRARHIRYVLNAQKPDGGFAGRSGPSDLYYTAFGLRALSILGELYGPVAERAANFLQSQLAREQTVVDFFSLFYAANLVNAAAGIDIFREAQPGWQARVADFLESLRRSDGGYAKSQEGDAGSTYHSFLVMLVYELLGMAAPNPDGLAAFLDRQREADGGWREIRASKRSGTNPSAAAVGALRLMNRLPLADQDLAIEYFLERQTDEGGLAANTRIPVADLLSTFTGMWTLREFGAIEQLDLGSLRRFVESLQLASGGFQAFSLDPAHDIEYTFYGIGCLALLQLHSHG